MGRFVPKVLQLPLSFTTHIQKFFEGFTPNIIFNIPTVKPSVGITALTSVCEGVLVLGVVSRARGSLCPFTPGVLPSVTTFAKPCEGRFVRPDTIRKNEGLTF